MKPTSLSPEFYENLYNEIIKSDIEINFDDDDRTKHYLDFEIDGLQVEVLATFEVVYVDESFDHAFGTEYAGHFDVGNFIDLDEVSIYDEDDNDVSDLFDMDRFWEQDKVFGVNFRNGTAINPGDECLFQICRNWKKGVYRYTEKQTGHHIVELNGAEWTLGLIYPMTEANLKNAGLLQ